MGMKYKDTTTGNFKEINVKVADTLPVGSEVDYNGTTIPTGWEEVDEYTTYEITNTPQHSLGTNNYQLAKFNKFVNFNMGVLWFNSITANDWFSIGTLPNIIRPSKGMCSIGVIMDDVGQIIGYARIEIETSGNIRIKSNVTRNSLSGVTFCVSWFI